MPSLLTTTTEIIRPIVLIVDDDAAVLAALRALLAPRLEPLYRIETAASAEEALELAAETSPEAGPLAAVISDEKMPGKQGTELLIALRQSPAHRFGGRIIITGYAGLESAKRAINEAEVVRYYPKPWDDEKQLIPALGEILGRFAKDAGLDEVLLAHAQEWTAASHAVENIRRAWWEYLTLMGLSAAEAEIEEPAFVEPQDASSVHVLATRRSPKERIPAAALRLEVAAPVSRIAAVAFRPEEANEATETLLLRTGLLEARRLGAEHVEADVPLLRRGVYEALGFTAVAEPDEQATSVSMRVRLAGASPLDGANRAFARRHESEQRQCRCSQLACPSRDYASARRSYFCPLDVLEGRVPAGFPARRRT